MKQTKNHDIVNLSELMEQFEVQRKDKLKSLKNEREAAVTALFKAQQIVAAWETEISRIDRQIKVFDDIPEKVGPFPAPVEGRRRTSADKEAAMEAVYRKISSEPGRRWKSSELYEAANAFKVRLLVFEHNLKLTDHPSKVIKPIQFEGEKKSRVYWV